VTEVLGYDGFGNVNTDSITGVNMTMRQTRVDWDATGQFPAIVTDPTGAQTRYGYNYSFGLRATLTDPNSTTSTLIFDCHT